MSILGKVFKKKEEAVNVETLTRYLAVLEEKHRIVANNLAFKTDKAPAQQAGQKLELARRSLHEISGFLLRKNVDGALNAVSVTKKSLVEYPQILAKLQQFDAIKKEAAELVPKVEKLESQVTMNKV